MNNNNQTKESYNHFQDKKYNKFKTKADIFQASPSLPWLSASTTTTSSTNSSSSSSKESIYTPILYSATPTETHFLPFGKLKLHQITPSKVEVIKPLGKGIIFYFFKIFSYSSK